MRPLTCFHLMAALLASVGALASPAVALAHGVAHAHERHEHERAHGTTADGTKTAAGAMERAASTPDDDDAPHPGLHADALAQVGSRLSAALVAVRVVFPAPVIALTRTAAHPPHAGVTSLGRAFPPDQARAPPVG